MTVTDSLVALDEVRELLGRYFDGLYRSDAGLLAGVLHSAALYATATEGTPPQAASRSRVRYASSVSRPSVEIETSRSAAA